MLFPSKLILYCVGAFIGAPLSLCQAMEVHENPDHSSNVINKRDVENLMLFKEIGSQFALPNEIIETILKIRVESQFLWCSFPSAVKLHDAREYEVVYSGG